MLEWASKEETKASCNLFAIFSIFNLFPYVKSIIKLSWKSCSPIRIGSHMSIIQIAFSVDMCVCPVIRAN